MEEAIVEEEEIEALLDNEQELDEEESIDCYLPWEDICGHIWETDWEDSERPHPGFAVSGGYVVKCDKCGMYFHDFVGPAEQMPPCKGKIK